MWPSFRRRRRLLASLGAFALRLCSESRRAFFRFPYCLQSELGGGEGEEDRMRGGRHPTILCKNAWMILNEPVRYKGTFLWYRFICGGGGG